VQVENHKYESRGLVNIIDNGNDDTIEIVELPIKLWTQNYKEKVIEPMFDGTDKKRAQIVQDYKEYHTDTTVHFVCKLKPEDLDLVEQQGIYDVFSLKTSINTSNMVAYKKI
jgi:DNA topoisomerase-2